MSLSFTERRNWSFSFFKNSVKMPNNFLRWKAATRYGKICTCTCGLSSKTDANQNFILNVRMLSSSDFPFLDGIHQRLWYGWTIDRNPQLFSLPYDKEKDWFGQSKTHQSCDFSPPVSFSSSSPPLFGNSPLPAFPIPYPARNALPQYIHLSSSIHVQCQRGRLALWCIDNPAKSVQMRSPEQTAETKLAMRQALIWGWDTESWDPERLKTRVMKQDLNKVGLFDKVSTILK